MRLIVMPIDIAIVRERLVMAQASAQPIAIDSLADDRVFIAIHYVIYVRKQLLPLAFLVDTGRFRLVICPDHVKHQCLVMLQVPLVI